MRLVPIGRVARAVGLDGRVGVGGTDGSLGRLGRVTLRRPGTEDVERRVLDARAQGRVWAVKLEGVGDRDAAQALVGSEVLARREDLGEAGAGFHFWADLEGLPVETAAGAAVGRVEGLVVTGGVDVLVVRGPGGERLVPLAPYVKVDLEARRIVVDAPPGLLDGVESEKGGPRAEDEAT
jgi:16S rRNA processing protein RimM